jgi:hypothetical protein
MKKIFVIALAVLLAAALSGCALDVIATGSVSAIQRVMSAMPQGAVKADGGLSIASPEGTARFLVKNDWSGGMDAMLEVDLKPLVAAGLDPAKLPKEGYLVEGDKLYVGRDLGDGALNGSAPIELYQALIAKRPDALGFHAALGHFGISLGGGMFEWTKDLAASDKDMVYVLDPAPLEAAGLKPENVTGWAYAQIPTMDAYGAKIEVYRLLKPFNLG